MSYTPASSKKDVGVLIPTNMRAPLEHAMRVLEDKVGDIDEFAAHELGYDDVDQMHDALMGLQVDSVAAAIQQMKDGKSIIIADQTGIGKGRQAAAIIRWAVGHNKIPVFMTVKPSLFTDMYGDLADIGSADVSPFIVNQDEAISLPNGNKVFGNKPGRHRANLEKIRNSGELPDDRNAVFVTYSQINTENLQRSVLSSLSRRAVFILDEAHTAAGESGTGEYMQTLLKNASAATYLSATYAKRPDNMPLYFRTDMGEAIGDKDKLAEAMSMGGLPLQTVISNNLVKAGQMFRRERSYDGVDIATIVDTRRSKEHTEMADSVTSALRAIVAADKKFHKTFVKQAQKEAKASGMAATGGGNKAANTIAHAEFTSVVHNFVRQMLLALKADTAADHAIEALKRGEKPLIAVEQTMGSFLQEYTANNGIQIGDALGDFTYRNVLSRSLERTRYVVTKDQQGNDHKRWIPLNELDPETRVEYDKAQKVIDGLKLDVPVSPIDMMRSRIEKAGYSIGEITGRNLAVDYSDPKRPKLSQVPLAEQNDKVATTRKFNDGRLDVILLNVSGSTGISLHASEKFKDQRKRHMIVAQPAQDINVFMQMLGRIHRTGQVELPAYTILATDLPAEKRPTALLSKKMKSLNANTSSNTESATSVKAADMLNKYGDEIVGRYLADNPELALQLGLDGSDSEEAKPDMARDATGKLAITPVKTQKAFYADVEQQYSDYIDYLNETNQNDLEPRTFDYDAKENRTSVISKGKNPGSPFGEDAVYGEYSIKAQSKPLTPEQVMGRIKDSLDGKTPQVHLKEMMAALDTQFNAWKATLDPEGAQLSAGIAVQQAAKSFLSRHQIGSTLRLDIKGDTFSAVVTNIESNHKGTGNPYSLSKLNVSLATTGATPSMKIPATQLGRITLANLYERPENLFRLGNSEARETAKIITGNLLAAYGELQDARGTVINFTKADGATEQGILLPKKFNVKENTVGDYRMSSPEHILKFLRDSKDPGTKLIGVSSRDGNVRVVMKDGQLVVATHKSKARGARFFLDPNLTKLTGDFVSSGNMMYATVPRANQTAALEELLNKAALYVPRSMADEAAAMEPSESDQAPATKTVNPPAGGTTLRSSLFGVDLLGEAVVKAAKVAWDKDVLPTLKTTGGTLKDVGLYATHLMVPTAGANRDTLDSFMRLKGDQERKRFETEQVFKGVEKMFDSIPEADRIDFLDRYKTGKAQISPELQKVADMYHTLDNGNYRLIIDAQVGGMDAPFRKQWNQMGPVEKDAFFDKVAKGMSFERPGDAAAASAGDKAARYRMREQAIADGTLSFKENHLRSFWKVVPGSLKERSNAGGKAPLRGDRGFTKQSTLPDVSTGMENGGVLETTNPQKLIEMNQASIMRYVTALNMFKEAGDLGRRKFVPLGEKAPDGWERVDDSMFRVFRPVTILKDDLRSMPDVIEKTGMNTSRGTIESGAWYMPEDDARLLNNYLSKDWFKTNAIGRGLLAVKNILTAIELSLSPFHLVFEGLESMGSQFGLGLMHSLNIGIGQGDAKAFVDGLRFSATAPAAPFTTARLGGSAIKSVGNYRQFIDTKRGQNFVKAYPNAPHLIDLYFTGGGTLGQPKEFQISMMEGARAAFKDGNYVGALFRAVPALSQTAMKPLFETYIPRLKLGFFLQMMSQQLAENHDALMSGKTTEAELARKVVNTVENRFGELNFSNLWWNNTLKSAMQLAFRSVTWKLGNWRGLASGVTGQTKAFADPLATMYADAKGQRKGANRKAGEYIPKLDMNMSWLLGMAVTTAALSTIITKLTTGKYPWEFLEDDKGEGKSALAGLALEMMHPRTGASDNYTGKPSRLSLPTGLRDFEHAYENPRTYLHGSEAGFVGKTLDSWDNRDFFGNYIYDPNGSTYQKLASLMAYNVPLPITVQTFVRGRDTGDMSRFKLGMVGMSSASKDLDLSPLEKYMEDVQRSKHIPHTPEDQDEYREKMKGIRDGTIHGPELHRELKEMRKPYLIRMFSKLNYQEARNAYVNHASPEEQQILRHTLNVKRQNALKSSPNMTRSEEAEAK